MSNLSRHKIIIDREPLSETEIAKNMDFGRFMAGRSAISWLSSAAKIWLSVSAGIAVMSAAAYFMLRSPETKAMSPAKPPFIAPPVQDYKAGADKFVIDAGSDTSFTYKTGSLIHIPANSFITKDGKDVEGPVEIRYREFHDQIDLLLSGIPMNYDSANVHLQFESAGMFEIEAYQNGELVQLKPGRELSVDMISYTDRNDYNVYYLDTMKRQWEYDSRNSRSCKDSIVSFEKQYEQFLEKNVPESQPILMPEKADPQLDNFVIDYNKEEFPELAVYDGVKFEVEPNDKSYRPELARTEWEDVLIERYGDQKHYKITFRTGKNAAAFVTKPVIEEASFENAYSEYEAKLKRHRQLLAHKADSLNALNNIATFRAKTLNGVNERFDRYIKSGMIFRALSIGRMGIWNCDAARKYELLFAVKKQMTNFPTVHFRSAADGGPLDIRIAYLIRRSVNTICPISYQTFERFPAELGQNADVLVGITDDKNVMYVKGSDLKKIDPKQKEIYLSMHESKDKQEAIAEIKSLLDL